MSISVLVLTDDSTEVFLNGTSIGSQPIGKFPDGSPDNVRDLNQTGDGWPFGTEDPLVFLAGVNTLRFRVVDIGDLTNVEYLATITYLLWRAVLAAERRATRTCLGTRQDAAGHRPARVLHE